MKRHATIQAWMNDRHDWLEECKVLRDVVLSKGFEEAMKWGQPTYILNGTNVLQVSYRKDCAVVAFFKGTLLPDPEGQLILPGQNTRHAKYLAFTSLDDIAKRRVYLEMLIDEAIEVERKGLKVEAPPAEIDYCEELQERLDADDEFREAFEALTPGRKRHYNMHFSQAKQAKTRVSRIEAATERIFMGKGLQDCICGHSKRMPRCDGSHKKHGRT